MRNESINARTALNDVTVLWDLNPREQYDAEDLVEQVVMSKDTTEITIWTNLRVGEEWAGHATEGQEVLMKGHRTVLAIELMKTTYPDVYAELFPDGLVEVRRFEGLSTAQESEYRNDHAAQKPIGTDYEIFKTMENLYANGLSATQVAVKMTPIFKIKGKNSKNYKDSLELEGPAKWSKLRSAWEGRIRIPRWIADLGMDVRDAYVDTIRNDRETPVPSINNDRVIELHKLWVADQKSVAKLIEAGNDLESISCTNIGPLCTEKLAEYKDADECNEPVVRSTRRTASQIADYVPKVKSDGYKDLFKWLNGEEAPIGTHDTRQFKSELVEAFFPLEYKEFVDSLYPSALEQKAAAIAKAKAAAEAKEVAEAQAAEAVEPKADVKAGKESKKQKSNK